mgnify:CR=1 FL=1
MPEGLAAFPLPEPHRRPLRPSNPMERAGEQEPKRPATRVFPSEGSLLRRVSAILVGIDEKRASDTKADTRRERQNA